MHYAACVFCSYINGLRSALVGEYSSLGCLCVLGLYGHLWRESVSVFDGFCVFVSVDVKYIIHYRRICEFICSL